MSEQTVDPDEMAQMSHLHWIYTACPDVFAIGSSVVLIYYCHSLISFVQNKQLLHAGSINTFFLKKIRSFFIIRLNQERFYFVLFHVFKVVQSS